MIITEFQKEISEKLARVDRLNSLRKKDDSLNLLTEIIDSVKVRGDELEGLYDETINLISDRFEEMKKLPEERIGPAYWNHGAGRLC